MSKSTKCIVLLYFLNNDTKDFLIFNNRNACNKYFKNEENLNYLKEKGLCHYKIVFGIIQEEY